MNQCAEPAITAPDAENAVAGAILIDDRCLPDILETELTPGEFAADLPRMVYATALELYGAEQPIDPVTVRDKAAGGLSSEYLLQLMEITPTAANAANYARMIKAAALKRKAAAIALRLSGQSVDIPGTVEELQEIAAQQAQFASAKKTGVDFFREFVQKIQTEAYAPCKTGMQDLDRLLSGGLRPQELVMLGGAPGIGKTAFTQQLFEGIAAQGLPVLYFNLEMSREQLFARSISRLIAREGGRVTAAEVMDGSTWSDEQGRAIEAACRRYAREVAPNISYNPMSGRTAALSAIMGAMIAEAEKARRNDTCAPCVVLDYLQLLEGEPKQEQTEVTKRAVKELKDYAIRYNTVVFVIMANNRESNKSGQASMDSGRDTSAIEYTADTMLQLAYTASIREKKSERLTPDQILSTADEQERQRLKSDVTLRVVKKRNGEPGRSMRFYFDGANSRYTPYSTRCDDFDRLPDSSPVPFD